MWEAVLEAQHAGLDKVRAGANGRDVHYACCEVFKQHGYGSLAKPYRDIKSEARFIHGTGHGLGLEIHEYPRVGDVDVTLEVGDVVTVEPGLYDPRFGGIQPALLGVQQADAPERDQRGDRLPPRPQARRAEAGAHREARPQLREGGVARVFAAVLTARFARREGGIARAAH